MTGKIRAFETEGRKIIAGYTKLDRVGVSNVRNAAIAAPSCLKRLDRLIADFRNVWMEERKVHPAYAHRLSF